MVASWCVVLALAAGAAPLAPDPVEYNGSKLLIGGAVAGGLGLAAKIAITTVMSRDLDGHRDSDSDSGGFHIPRWVPITVFSAGYNPLIGAGLTLVGIGSFYRGQWAADQDLFRHSRAKRPKPQSALGLVLLTAGIGVWGGTRIGMLRCETEKCQIALLEGGYYAALALTSTGVPLATWSIGYEKYAGRWASVAQQLRLSPAVSRDHAGITVSGRF